VEGWSAAEDVVVVGDQRFEHRDRLGGALDVVVRAGEVVRRCAGRAIVAHTR
jgi:hypothetical protein